MSCTEYNAALDEWVDGTLSPDARARLEGHFETCASCRALANDLRRLREAGRALPKVEPPPDGWLRLSAALDREQGAKAGARVLPMAPAQPAAAKQEPAAAKTAGLSLFASRRPLWAALAAAALVVLAVATTLLLYPTGNDTTTAGGDAVDAGHAADANLVQSIETELQLADQHYQNAIAGLEKVFREGEGTLDATTAAVLTRNLGILDQAVRESREALKAQQTSEVPQATLFEALRRKVELLKDTVSLINEMRKGNQAGAAQIVGSLER
jgi:hypothetical protein